MSEHAEHNAYLFNYPHMAGVWKDEGIIVGTSPMYPQLFKMNGNKVIATWKDPLLADE